MLPEPDDADSALAPLHVLLKHSRGALALGRVGLSAESTTNPMDLSSTATITTTPSLRRELAVAGARGSPTLRDAANAVDGARTGTWAESPFSSEAVTVRALLRTAF